MNTYEYNLTFKTDPFFERLIQPYSMSSISELKQSLLQDESLREVHIWNGYYLNDKQKHELLLNMGLTYKIKEHSFSNRNFAALYICNEQQKRNDLTAEYSKYLIGMEFHYKKVLHYNKISDDGTAITKKYHLAESVAKERFVNSSSVVRYYALADAINTIGDMEPELSNRILMGTIRISRDNVLELSRLRKDELKNVVRIAAERGVDKIDTPLIRYAVKNRYAKNTKSIIQINQERINSSKPPAIQQMPAYDPDSEVNSLCMTIGSWVSSIERVNNKVNFDRVTPKAKIQLIQRLSFLKSTICNIQETLVERTEA
jgi:hypothetical protein